MRKKKTKRSKMKERGRRRYENRRKKDYKYSDKVYENYKVGTREGERIKV